MNFASILALSCSSIVKIHSFQSVNGFPFGSERSVLSGMGTAAREARNGRGEEEEVTVGNAIYRFASNKLVEVSFRLALGIEINGQEVPAAALVSFLKEHDSNFRHVYGFAVAPDLGLAVDTEHDDRWVTAFVAGRWDHVA